MKKLCERGVIGRDDTVVSVVTGNGLKDVAQRHQGLRRAHLHPQRHGPAAEGLCGKGDPGGIRIKKSPAACWPPGCGLYDLSQGLRGILLLREVADDVLPGDDADEAAAVVHHGDEVLFMALLTSSSMLTVMRTEG